MAEEIAFENGRISNLEELVTSTLDRVILYTVVYHSLTPSSTLMPNFMESKKLCVDGRMDVYTYVQMDRRTFETHFIRSTQKSPPKNQS